MNENVCNDNRFNLIAKYKAKLIEATNIETSQDEMAVIDNILFRMWQMGWLDKLDAASPWHRVEDGLPEKDEWVLTITKSYKGARIYNIATVDSDGRWWTPSQNGMREIHYIEYWMPIEPPKEDA